MLVRSLKLALPILALLAAVAQQAADWIGERAAAVSQPAVVFDIDETALANWEVIERDNFGRPVPGPCDLALDGPCGWAAWDNLARSAAIGPTLAAFQKAQASKVTIFFITGRPENQREATEKDFVVGLNGFITHWDGKDDAGKPAAAGKYFVRGYAVGELDIEGVAYFGNDWIADEDSARVSEFGEMKVAGREFSAVGGALHPEGAFAGEHVKILVAMGVVVRRGRAVDAKDTGACRCFVGQVGIEQQGLSRFGKGLSDLVEVESSEGRIRRHFVFTSLFWMRWRRFRSGRK